MLNKKFTLGIGITLIAVSACQVPKAIHKSADWENPKAFKSEAKNTTSAPLELKKEDFFNDPLLLKLLDKVFQQNSVFKNALYEQAVAEAQLKMRRLALLPTLQLSTHASGTKYGKYTMEGVGNFDTNLSGNIEEDQKVGLNPTPDFWLGLRSTWEIDLWGKLRNSKKAALQRYLATQAYQKLIATQIICEVSTYYYELIALDNEVAILRENIRLQEEGYAVVELQYEVGRATSLAVNQFKAQLLQSRAILEKTLSQVADVEQRILSMIGEFSGPIERNTNLSLTSQHIAQLAYAPEQIFAARPDVQQAYWQFEASKADAKSARAAFFPQLEVSAFGAFHAFSSQTWFNPYSLAWQALAGITAPIFQQGKIRGQFNIANQQQEIAYWNYRQSVVNAYTEVNSIFTQLNHANEIVKIKSREVQVWEEAISTSHELYTAGYANYLEIIEAQRNKLQAELDKVNALKTQAHAGIFLFRALGGSVL